MKKGKIKELASRAFNFGYAAKVVDDLDILNMRFNVWFEEEYVDVLIPDKKAEKPILGIMPAKMYYEERKVELLEVINRYIKDCKEIPTEYVYEYNTLVKLSNSVKI